MEGVLSGVKGEGSALEIVGGTRFEFKQSRVGADRVMGRTVEVGQGPKAEGRWALILNTSKGVETRTRGQEDATPLDTPV
jgi:hypothetical protein